MHACALTILSDCHEECFDRVESELNVVRWKSGYWSMADSHTRCWVVEIEGGGKSCG